MRVSLVGDSASTDQVRSLCVALHRIGLTATLQVGVNGPEAWRFETPALSEQQFAMVVGQLVKFDGTPIADLLPIHDGRIGDGEFSVGEQVRGL